MKVKEKVKESASFLCIILDDTQLTQSRPGNAKNVYLEQSINEYCKNTTKSNTRI